MKRDPCLFKYPVCLPATDEQRGRSLTSLIMGEDTDLGTRTCGEFGILRHVDCWGNLRATYSHKSLHLMIAFALGTVLVKVSIAIKKHQDQNQLGEEKVYCLLQLIVHNLWMSGQELKAGA